jgi:HK97 family phage major capsid protein
MPDKTTEPPAEFMPESMDDLRGRTPDELRKMAEVLDAHLKALHQTDEGELRDLTDDEESAFNLGMQLRTEILDRLDKHTKIADVFRRRPAVVQQAYANIRYGLDDPAGDTRRLTNPEARDKALRVLDSRDAADLSDAQKTQVEKMLRRDTITARRILVTENEDYRSAWMKMVTDVHPVLTPEENRAVQAWYEFRALGDWTTTAGGFGIPVFIDPSIILTAQESGNPFLSIAKQVTVNTNQWKGVSSAGVTWAFQTEAAATTDNSPTLAQPTVLVHMARGFIPYSIEVGMDYPGFASEMSTLLAQGYDELLVQKFTNGSGTGEPKGILTAISAVSGDRVKLASGTGLLTAADPYAVWKALPQKYRRNASWLMSIGVNNGIRQLGAANVFHGYTVNLPEGWADQLFGKPVYESAYMPDTTTWTTTAEGQAIVGDFSNFVIARNGGMSVELVPQLFSQLTAGQGQATPTGQRGWFAYARIGSDSSNTAGFRLLVANS